MLASFLACASQHRGARHAHSRASETDGGHMHSAGITHALSKHGHQHSKRHASYHRHAASALPPAPPCHPPPSHCHLPRLPPRHPYPPPAAEGDRQPTRGERQPGCCTKRAHPHSTPHCHHFCPAPLLPHRPPRLHPCPQVPFVRPRPRRSHRYPQLADAAASLRASTARGDAGFFQPNSVPHAGKDLTTTFST